MLDISICLRLRVYKLDGKVPEKDKALDSIYPKEKIYLVISH